MLRAYHNMSFNDFIGQIRDMAIAWNMAPMVVDKIDAMFEPMSQDAIDNAINEAEEKAYDKGQKEERDAIISEMHAFLDNNEDVTAEELLKHVSS